MNSLRFVWRADEGPAIHLEQKAVRERSMLTVAQRTSGRLSFEQTRARVELFIRGRNEVIDLISSDDRANRTAAALANTGELPLRYRAEAQQTRYGGCLSISR
jgi:hypothetical protein